MLPQLRRRYWIPVLLAALAMGAFLLALALNGVAAGFPLDDGWIHQTYARNLALRGEFAFVPGKPSAGSTSPLWTLLLTPGAWLGLAPFIWTWALGAMTLIITALAGAALARELFPEKEITPLLVAAVLATEWHIVWGAASGMETSLFAAGVLALLTMSVRWGDQPPDAKGAFWGGLGVGVLMLVRPEGILLGGILGLAVVFHYWPVWQHFRPILTRGLWAILGLGCVLLPYLLLNLHLSGTLFPNTFYAKQEEYRIIYSQPFWQRLFNVILPLLAGPLALLLPAIPWALPDLREKPHIGLPLLWAVGTWILYAWRLPVSYQHGRYLIPIVPPLLTLGVGGVRRLWRRSPRGPGWILTRAWAIAILVVTLVFLGRGAEAFATDVAIINGEMVDVAQWVNIHTPRDAQIAAHDIGALGYFTQRELLDLAGLISPEVTPFIRDEAQLLAWMEAQEADYLVTFPSWYPDIVADPRLEKIYQTDTAITRQLGKDNMAVYRCQWTAKRD